VHHNSRPGVSTKLGVDAATLHALKPELVVEETSGYGLDGPKAQRAGFDMLFQAFCGHEFRGSGEGDVPLWNRSAIVDFGAGMLGAIGVLFALLQQRRGESPPAIYVNLLDTGLYLMSELIERADGSWAGTPRMNVELTGSHPAERLYQTSDGWLAIVVRGDAMARRLANALGLQHVLAMPVASWSEKEGNAIASAINSRSTKDVAAALTAANIWFEISHADRRDHAMADEELQKCGIVLRTADRKYGDFRQIGPAFRFSRTPLKLDARGHIPAVGEHSRKILGELGYSQSEIDGLFRDSAVA
jgi:crotonobetainyl-CoA:carnitine CoA-transferase CaiB-like acyl-CoA transferase